ncbi:MAG: hypothetical protein PHI35_05730 [Victivallaceae bacterium]|nr:hypothetical protein [Victivallaceae bacterium]
MECYGHSFDRRPECVSCKLRKYCAEAADPPLFADQSPPPELLEKITQENSHGVANRLQRAERDRRYTRADLIEVIGFMAALDLKVLDIIAEKIDHPELHLSEIAVRGKVSRQAVHRLVTQRLSRIPELETVITYNRHRNTFSKDKTFMEEVCQIRRRIRSTRSNSPKQNSNFLRRLNCSIRNTNSSPTNILKGSAILKNA